MALWTVAQIYPTQPVVEDRFNSSVTAGGSHILHPDLSAGTRVGGTVALDSLFNCHHLLLMHGDVFFLHITHLLHFKKAALHRSKSSSHSALSSLLFCCLLRRSVVVVLKQLL